MHLRHIVAATDESDAGRQGVRTALALSSRTGARVTVMRTVATRAAAFAGIPMGDLVANDTAQANLERLQRWIEADLAVADPKPQVSFALTYGVPGIEIGHFAERERADLLVLGRKQRSLLARLVVGDTADAVSRRSMLPCFFVSGTGALPQDVLVAVDTSERAMTVLAAADAFARQAGAVIHVVTVEPRHEQEPDTTIAAPPDGRTARLAGRVRAAVGQELEVRRGDPVTQILATVSERHPDVLVIGCHRGGPPGIIDAGSVSRRVAHAAPCAILTVPL